MAAEYQAKQAAAYAGISLMMLNYLERQGVFVRQGAPKEKRRGRRRHYSFRDVVVLRAINRLLERGVSVERIRKAIISMATDEELVCERNLTMHKEASVQYFVTDGSDIYYARDSDELVTLTQEKQLAFAFVLDLTDVRRHVEEVVPQRTASVRKRA